jgi:hypothetical protein
VYEPNQPEARSLSATPSALQRIVLWNGSKLLGVAADQKVRDGSASCVWSTPSHYVRLKAYLSAVQGHLVP